MFGLKDNKHIIQYTYFRVKSRYLSQYLVEILTECSEGYGPITIYCYSNHILLWAWFDPASHGMLVAVSLDRLLSILIPFKYKTLTTTYTYCVTTIVYAITLAMATVIFVTNWPNVEPVYSKICWSNHGYGMSGSYIRDTTVAVTTLASVGIYLSSRFCTETGLHQQLTILKRIVGQNLRND